MSYAKKRYQDRIKKAFGNQDQKEKDDEGELDPFDTRRNKRTGLRR